MTKAEIEREVQEGTIYRVQPDFGRGSNVYRVDKMFMDVIKDTYHVQVRQKPAASGHGEIEVFCDCPGFIRQKFDKTRHKHVRIALDYIDRVNVAAKNNTPVPVACDYRFKGTGATTEITFLRAHKEIPSVSS